MRFIFLLLVWLPSILFGQIDQSNYRSWLRTNNQTNKLALVIGNSQYQYGTSLSEPANDANTIAQALEQQGYNVVLGYNLDYNELHDAVDEFADKLQTYQEAVVYYAGHGFQVNGKNYIIPTDANPRQARQVARHCMEVSYLLEAIDRPEIPKLLLIDACRNNPFASNWTDAKNRDLTQGMKAVKILSNSLVVFSTAENTKVLDKNPFAEIMAKSLQKGGCIDDILRTVSLEVRALDRFQLIRPTGLLDKKMCFGTEKAGPQDSDGDGLLDHIDNCPYERGEVANGGCPKKENNLTGDSGTFTDDRDGQEYKWVRLEDGNIWMTQNLNYKTTDSWWYDNKSSNGDKYGRLYTWQVAKKACPSGWRLPTDDEWWQMASYYGKAYNRYSGQTKNESSDGGEAAYKALMQGGNTGFSALLGGYRDSGGDFRYLGDYGTYWSGSEKSSSRAWYYYFISYSKTLYRSSNDKSVGRSCRCLQD